ncbi:MAG: hypothetical protein PHG05_04325 [Candidatus Nanoarchaeia archaeon]|nr:hypothetical protein [Candidatus Nanoarchaeia archaeon]
MNSKILNIEELAEKRGSIPPYFTEKFCIDKIKKNVLDDLKKNTKNYSESYGISQDTFKTVVNLFKQSNSPGSQDWKEVFNNQKNIENIEKIYSDITTLLVSKFERFNDLVDQYHQASTAKRLDTIKELEINPEEITLVSLDSDNIDKILDY